MRGNLRLLNKQLCPFLSISLVNIVYWNNIEIRSRKCTRNYWEFLETHIPNVLYLFELKCDNSFYFLFFIFWQGAWF